MVICEHDISNPLEEREEEPQNPWFFVLKHLKWFFLDEGERAQHPQYLEKNFFQSGRATKFPPLPTQKEYSLIGIITITTITIISIIIHSPK